MAARDEVLQQARSRGARALTEFEAKRFLAEYGFPVPRKKAVDSLEAALAAAEVIGYPVALKGSGEELLHKTELGLVRLGLKNDAALREAYDQLTAAAKVPLKEMLVQQMVTGDRELVAGHGPRSPVRAQCTIRVRGHLHGGPGRCGFPGGPAVPLGCHADDGRNSGTKDPGSLSGDAAG